MSRGIDYGRGVTNIDTATRIRYGVISQHSLADWFYDEYEPQYGEPTCPKCGNAAVNVAAPGGNALPDAAEEWENISRHGCDDYACLSCEHYLDSSDAFPEEPQGFKLEDDEYLAVDCLDSDVMVLRSPFYTFAPFCSPCVPGAGNLDSAVPEDRTDDVMLTQYGAKTYCFGHDYFEGERAPYRVFRVTDDSEVLPEVR